MKKDSKKKSIMPILRDMKVGEVEEWDITRYNTVEQAIFRLRNETADKKAFSRRKNFTTIQVKRIK